MSNFITTIAQLYEMAMSVRKDENYGVDRENLQHLYDIIKFFESQFISRKDRIKEIQLVPREESGSVAVRFLVFSIFGEDLKRFCEVMQYASALSFESIDDMVHIEVVVPHVFREKK